MPVDYSKPIRLTDGRKAFVVSRDYVPYPGFSPQTLVKSTYNMPGDDRNDWWTTPAVVDEDGVPDSNGSIWRVENVPERVERYINIYSPTESGILQTSLGMSKNAATGHVVRNRLKLTFENDNLISVEIMNADV